MTPLDRIATIPLTVADRLGFPLATVSRTVKIKQSLKQRAAGEEATKNTVVGTVRAKITKTVISDDTKNATKDIHATIIGEVQLGDQVTVGDVIAIVVEIEQNGNVAKVVMR